MIQDAVPDKKETNSLKTHWFRKKYKKGRFLMREVCSTVKRAVVGWNV